MLRNNAGFTRDDDLAEVLAEGIWSVPRAGGSSSGHPGARNRCFLPLLSERLMFQVAGYPG